jgi:hypothetical protein
MTRAHYKPSDLIDEDVVNEEMRSIMEYHKDQFSEFHIDLILTSMIWNNNYKGLEYIKIYLQGFLHDHADPDDDHMCTINGVDQYPSICRLIDIVDNKLKDNPSKQEDDEE